VYYPDMTSDVCLFSFVVSTCTVFVCD